MMDKAISATADLEKRVLMAIGLADSLGLPFENLKRSHVKRLIEKTSVRQIKLSNGKALISDDTEHALMTIRAMSESGCDPNLFEEVLGRKIGQWCKACPPGIGRATLRSSFKMICGVRPARAGVRSAGNGPLMRVPAIAIRHRGDPDKLMEFVRISTSITHTDIRAISMALFVAEIMTQACKSRLDWRQITSCFEKVSEAQDIPLKFESEMRSLLDAIGRHDPATAITHDAMAAIGCAAGVSGYIVHTAIAASWISVRAQGDIHKAIDLSIEAGGDTDSLAAVAAAITACSPSSHMPDNALANFAGSFAGGDRILCYAEALSPCSSTRSLTAPEPSVAQQFRDNMRALRAMVRHIFWRRIF